MKNPIFFVYIVNFTLFSVFYAQKLETSLKLIWLSLHCPDTFELGDLDAVLV